MAVQANSTPILTEGTCMTFNKHWSKWTIEIKVWKILVMLIIIPILTMWFLVVHQSDEIIALSRNEVVVDTAGNRIWYGTFFNTDSMLYRDLAVRVHFLDSNGQTVGEAKGEVDELQPGKGLNLQANLPAEAVNLRIYSVQWRNDRDSALIGPFREPWEFGYLQYDPKK